jgi:hypothetical protein
MKTCKRCGTEKDRDEFYRLTGSQYKDHWDCRDSYCIPCRKIYVRQRSWSIKRKAVAYLGNKCVRCGLETNHVEIYDFHHKDPSKKDFTVSKNRLAFDTIKPELDKCELLCANCHRIVEYTFGAYNEWGVKGTESL